MLLLFNVDVAVVLWDEDVVAVHLGDVVVLARDDDSRLSDYRH